jgi:uncharacterized protein YbjQ (UPF0145 family)
MPSILKIIIHSARNLTKEGGEPPDTLTEITFSRLTPRKTDVVKASRDPDWRNASFKLEISDDNELATSPLVLRVIDRDLMREVVIGTVSLSLEPLLRGANAGSLNKQHQHQQPHLHHFVASAPTLDAWIRENGIGGGSAQDTLNEVEVESGSAAPNGAISSSNAADENTGQLGLVRSGGLPQICGWFPIFDTLLGIRGMLKVTVELRTLTAGVSGPINTQTSTKAAVTGSVDDDIMETAGGGIIGQKGELISTAQGEINDHQRNTSAGRFSKVHLFSLDRLDTRIFPYQVYRGFVEEILVQSDPEHQSQVVRANVSSSRAELTRKLFKGTTAIETAQQQLQLQARRTNELRQLVLHKLAYSLRNNLANKAASIGANAVVGMQLHFDVESRRGTVVGRAFGTAMAIYRPRLADDPLHGVLRTEALAYQQKIQVLSRSSPASLMKSSSTGQLNSSSSAVLASVPVSSFPNSEQPEGVTAPITVTASPVIKSSSSPTLQPLEPLDISSIEANGRERTTSSSFLSMRGREKSGTINDRDRGTTAYATDAIAAAIDAALFELIDKPQSFSEAPTPLASDDAPTPSFLSFTRESSMPSSRSFASSQSSQAPLSSSNIKTAFESASDTSAIPSETQTQLPHLALVAASVAQQVVGGGSLTRNSSTKLLTGTATASSATTSGSGHVSKMQRSSSSIPLLIGPSTTPFVDERTMNKIDRDASNRLRVASAVSQFAPLHRYSTVAEIRRHDSINLLTVSSTPPGSRMHIGGLVAVRTVKFLGFSQKPSKSSERFAVSHSFDQATRDAWWAELRRELREHAAKLGCTQVMGYREETEIQGEACILSVFGTAVRLKNIKSQGQVRTARREIEGDGPGARKRRNALSSDEKRSLRRAWVAEPLRRPWYVKPMNGVFDDAAIAAKSAEAAFSQLREARTSLLALRSSSASSGNLTRDLPLLNEEREDDDIEGRGRSLSMSALSTKSTSFNQVNEPATQSLSVKALVEERELLASLALKAPGNKKKAILAAAASTALTNKLANLPATVPANGSITTSQSIQPSVTTQAPVPQPSLHAVVSTALLIGRFKQHPSYAVSKLSDSHDLCVLPPGLISNDPLCAPSAPAQLPCSYVHLRSSLSIGSTVSQAPFDNMVTSRCRCCGVGFVPNVLLASIEPPPSLPTAGPGIYIEARAVRRKLSSSKGVNECIVLSEDLVFLEQAMHQQLMLKLRALGRNAIFSVRSSVAFQSNLVIGSISGTAILVSAMPPPGPFSLRRDMKDDVRGLFDDLQARSKRHRETLSQHIEHSDFAANALIPRAVLNFSDTRVKYIKHRRIAIKAIKARRALVVAALDSARDQVQPFDTMGDDSVDLSGVSKKNSKMHLRGGSSGKNSSSGSARKAESGASRRKYRDALPEASPHASVGKSRNSSRGNIRSRSSRNPLKGGVVEDDSDDDSDSDTDSDTSSSESDETDSSTEDEKDGGVNKAKTAAKSDDEDEDSDGRSSTESEGSVVKDASIVREKHSSLGKSNQGSFFRRGFRAGVASNVYGDDDDGDRAAPTIPGALTLPLYLIEVDGDEQADDIENLLDEIEPPPGVNIVSTDAPTPAYISPDGQGPLLYPLIAPSLASKPSYSAFHPRAIKKGKQLVEKRAATAELFTEGQEPAAERAKDPSIWSSAVTQAKHMRHLHLSLRVKWSDLLTKASPTSTGNNDNDEDADRFLFGGVPSMSAMFTNSGESHHIGLTNDEDLRSKSYPLPQQREGSGGGVSTSQTIVNEDAEGGSTSSRVNFEGENNDAEGEGAGEREGTLFQRIFTTLTGQRDDEDEDEDENEDGVVRGTDRAVVGSADVIGGEESTEYGEESSASAGGLAEGGGSGNLGNGASVRKMDISRTTCLHNAVMGLVYARLRTFAPCTLTGLRISLSLPEPNEVSITVNGTLVQEASAIVSLDPNALVTVFNNEKNKQLKDEELNASIVGGGGGGGGGGTHSRGTHQFDVVAEAAKVRAKERSDNSIDGYKGKFPLLSLPRSSVVLSPASLVEAVALARLHGSEPDATKMVFKDNTVAPTIVLSAHSALQRFLFSLVRDLSFNASVDDKTDQNDDDAGDPATSDPVSQTALVSAAPSALAVQITSGTHLVGFRTVAYLGSINLVVVREDLSVSANNSQTRAPHLSGFLQDVFEESSALACSQASCLGGNALLGFRTKIVETSARGAYQLIVVSADVAYVVSDN